MAAISFALELIPSMVKIQNYHNVVIVSDSQAALKKLKQPCCSADSYFFWRKILEILNSCRLYFVWVPGHVGYPPNERADQVARLAVNNVLPDTIPPVFLLPSQLCPRLERRDRARQLHRLYCNIPDQHFHLRHFDYLKGSRPFGYSSLEFAWLRFFVNRPLYFISGKRITLYTGFCLNCPTVAQSAYHFFYECPRYQNARETLMYDLAQILALPFIPLAVILTCGNIVNPARIPDTADAISFFCKNGFN